MRKLSRSSSDRNSIFDSFLFWATLLVITWSGVPALAKEGAGQFNGFEMTLWINLFALPVVTLWVLPKKQRQTLAGYSQKAVLKLVGIGLLGNLLRQILYFSSYRSITAITGSVMTRLSGILFVAASIIFLKERHHWVYILAIALATIGSVLSTTRPGAQLEFSFTVGFWFMIVAALLNTLYQFANNAVKRQFSNANVNLFIFKTGTLLVIGVWAIMTQLDAMAAYPGLRVDLTPRISNLFTPFLIGAIADGIGFLAFLKMIELGDSVKVTIVTTLVAVGQVLLAVLISPNTVSFVNAMLGPALVIIPTTIAGYLDARKRV